MLAAPVSQAIENVYLAFASELKPRQIEACPCCVDHEAIRSLLNTPLRELSAQQLSGYTSSVLLTVGSETDFRHFLPRILEISLTDEHSYLDVEIILGKLPRASWHRWPQKQRDTLIALFRAVFEASIQDPEEPGWKIDTWICALALAGAELTRFLEMLLRPEAAAALIEFHDLNSQKLLMKGKLANAFWNGHADEMKAVAVWLKSSAVVTAVDRARGAMRQGGL
jgi:hypothetical protein